MTLGGRLQIYRIVACYVQADDVGISRRMVKKLTEERKLLAMLINMTRFPFKDDSLSMHLPSILCAVAYLRSRTLVAMYQIAHGFGQLPTSQRM